MDSVKKTYRFRDVLVKWLGGAISQRVIPGSSPMSRESDDLFRKNLHFP